LSLLSSSLLRYYSVEGVAVMAVGFLDIQDSDHLSRVTYLFSSFAT